MMEKDYTACSSAPAIRPGRCHFPWGRCGVFNGDGEANGEVYLSCVQGVSGMLREPMRWKVKGSLITEVDGGGEIGEECKRLFKEVPESNRLIEIMFGYHPTASAEYGSPIRCIGS
jgi:hypothetical protein